jgi:hypothetical protein
METGNMEQMTGRRQGDSKQAGRGQDEGDRESVNREAGMKKRR